MTEWVISDTHFFHNNIINFCKRPFADTQQMNESLIRRWNGVVQHDDIVYHLGDVGTGGSGALKKVVSRLNGKKVLILGNHDKGPIAMREIGFDVVLSAALVSLPKIQKRVWMQHHPMYTVPPFGIDHVIHGHIHNSTEADRERAKEGAKIPLWNINVSVEVINYQPVALEHLVHTAKPWMKWAKENGY